MRSQRASASARASASQFPPRGRPRTRRANGAGAREWPITRLTTPCGSDPNKQSKGFATSMRVRRPSPSEAANRPPRRRHAAIRRAQQSSRGAQPGARSGASGYSRARRSRPGRRPMPETEKTSALGARSRRSLTVSTPTRRQSRSATRTSSSTTHAPLAAARTPAASCPRSLPRAPRRRLAPDQHRVAPERRRRKPSAHKPHGNRDRRQRVTD